MNPEPLFHIQRDDAVAGPYDLVQMAGLLRRKIISSDTMTRREGEEEWKPFSWQPQFSIVREISPDAVSERLIALDEDARAANAPPIPLPSRETMLKLVALAVGTLLAGGVSFLLSLTSATVGYGLLIGGIGAVAVATCLGYVRMLDESNRTLAAIFFVPCYEVYYLLANIGKYFDLICVKYVGAAVAAGAAIALGLGANHP